MLVYKSENDVYRFGSELGSGYVARSIIRDNYTDNIETRVSDLGDDIVSITLHRFFYNNITNEAEDFGLDTYENLFVSREHALEFANIIIETLGK